MFQKQDIFTESMSENYNSENLDYLDINIWQSQFEQSLNSNKKIWLY